MAAVFAHSGIAMNRILVVFGLPVGCLLASCQGDLTNGDPAESGQETRSEQRIAAELREDTDPLCGIDCLGRVCGPDGCGGSCGSCANDEYCTEGGHCSPLCTPDCDGKQCGSDGCGDDCGACEEWPNSYCTEESQCACLTDCEHQECGDDGCGGSCGYCPGDFSCLDGACVPDCVPDCDGKDCGADGCSGFCGACPEGSYCFEGVCVDDCTPDCGGKDCGGNGCGGSCGICGGGTECSNGHCAAVYCEGYSKDNSCCKYGDPCAFTGNGICDCDGKCSWDVSDCESDGNGGLCDTCDNGNSCLQGFVCAYYQPYPDSIPFCVPPCAETSDCPDGFYCYLGESSGFCWVESQSNHVDCFQGDQWLVDDTCGVGLELLETCVDGSVCVEAECQCVKGAGITCSNGDLWYVDSCGELEGVAEYCPYGCPNGQSICATCEPECQNKQCGNDGCGGTCGTCSDENVCQNDQCLPITPECPNGVCTPPESSCSCPQDCGAPCAGKECGEDPCGGSCGTCPGSETCQYGQCIPVSDKCGDSNCSPPGETKCSCPQDCGSPCGDKKCGSSGCGWSCGSCQASYTCSNGDCVKDCDSICSGKCGSYQGCTCGGCPGGQTCHNSSCCTPKTCNQLGKKCGTWSNGCGGQVNCPSCNSGYYCGNGLCKKKCGNGLCDAGESECNCPGDCGVPCAGKKCGDDGCGGSCGSCLSGYSCISGTCSKNCGNGSCGVGENCGNCPADCKCAGSKVCYNSACCMQKDCTQLGKECGSWSDGCGSQISCGTCTGQDECNNGKCKCEPECQGKNCGSDGCGGSCGTCSGQDKCVNGKCECLAKCAGKCSGASNGCGGTCSGNDCSGCCSGSTCKLGTSDSNCGKNGGSCTNCTDSGEVCENKQCDKICQSDPYSDCDDDWIGCNLGDYSDDSGPENIDPNPVIQEDGDTVYFHYFVDDSSWNTDPMVKVSWTSYFGVVKVCALVSCVHGENSAMGNAGCSKVTCQKGSWTSQKINDVPNSYVPGQGGTITAQGCCQNGEADYLKFTPDAYDDIDDDIHVYLTVQAWAQDCSLADITLSFGE